MSRKKKSEFDFEEALTELDTLLEQMESGKLTLEESLSQFERGIQLTRQCQGLLKQAEQKVDLLIQKDGEMVLEDFESEPRIWTRP
jgi:exodeoxyribonuclease VII small subunit